MEAIIANPADPSAALRLDLLAAPTTETVHIAVTTNCNLRCTYCAVSQPIYVGADLDLGRFDELVEALKAQKVRHVNFSGHGETTMIAGWDAHCEKLLDAGFSVSITSNFAREFTAREVDVLARMAHILISCDTVDRKLFRDLRRHADLRTLLYNMMKIRAAALQRRASQRPTFVWNCVVSDLVVFDLEAWVAVGIAAGVDKFSFANLVQYEPLPNALYPRHVASLPREEVRRAAHALADAVELIQSCQRDYEFQDGLIASIRQALREEPRQQPAEWEWTSPTAGSKNVQVYAGEIPEGMTRDCLDAWNFAFVQPHQGVWPCCWLHEDLGNVAEQRLPDIMNGARARELRRQLLTGELEKACRHCPARGLTSTDALRRRVATFLAAEIERVRER